MSADALNPTSVARVFWKPTLYRAIVAIIFSLFGIFWVVDTPELLVALATAFLFLLDALFLWPVTRLTALPERMRTGLTSAALGWVVAGVILFFFRDPLPLAGLTAFGLALGGVSELVAGWGYKGLGRTPIDMVITGGISLIGAVVMALVAVGVGSNLDAHGVFGTAAMIVVILGVHQVLAALGYRRDANKEASQS